MDNQGLSHFAVYLRGSVGLDPDPGRQKWSTKIENVNKFYFLKCWMFSFDPGSLKMLDADPDSMNSGPQHCLEVIKSSSDLNWFTLPKSPVGTKAG
jgi:hypothetical protein